MSLIAAALILWSGLHDHHCRPMKVTGYVRSDFGPNARTYDGTLLYGEEALAAASWDIPLQSIVQVEGVGTFRVADRGQLGNSGWIDIATWTRSRAYEITGSRLVCVYPAGSLLDGY